MNSVVNPGLIVPSVSESLKRFVCANVPLLSEGLVAFDSPADWEHTKENSLLIYLYQVDVNPYLRNMPDRIVLNQSLGDHPFSLTAVPAPLVLDLTYMMVAYGSTGEMEQMIAGALINLLDTCGYIPDAYLMPTLRVSGNDLLSVVPDATSIHELRDLWSAFSQKGYHLTKVYKVPSVRIPSSVAMPVDMVVHADMVAHPLGAEKGDAEL